MSVLAKKNEGEESGREAAVLQAFTEPQETKEMKHVTIGTMFKLL